MHVPPPVSPAKRALTAGFTLIELSIVLVIIGLIVGGILVGQSLVSAAAVRAQITQIEKYNTAANTFYGKYGYLPGDIPDPAASSFGFQPRGPNAGEGDGNGWIEGVVDSGQHHDCSGLISGEAAMFWVDLSTARLIDGGFNTATATALQPLSLAQISSYLPAAKIGNGNYVYAWGNCLGFSGTPAFRDSNYFTVEVVLGTNGYQQINGALGITVQQAYAIDSKIDDGLPQAGRVLAAYWTGYESLFWSNPPYQATNTVGNAVLGNSTTCYDNSNVAGATQQYSLEISNGSNVNCALSFKMQAGDR